MSFKVRDIVTHALAEIGAYAQGEAPSADDANFALGKLKSMLDMWRAQKLFVFTKTFTAYTLTPNLQPHTIGPSTATFTVAQRPEKLEGAAIILNTSTPNTDIPLNIRDAAWWADERVKSLSSSLPTDLYYSPDWPNGSLYLWPIPTIAYGIRLETWGLLTALASLNDDFSFPPGYEEAITLSLAERLCNPFNKELTPLLAMQAREARAVIKSANATTPKLVNDAPGSQRGSNFNYLSRSSN